MYVILKLSNLDNKDLIHYRLNYTKGEIFEHGYNRILYWNYY